MPEAKLTVRVTPNAPKNEIAGSAGGVLRIKIAAPPVDNKANDALIEFLSHVLGIRKSALTLVRGQTSRIKTVAIDGLSPEEVMKRLSSFSARRASKQSPEHRPTAG